MALLDAAEVGTQFYTYDENSESRLMLHDGQEFDPVSLTYET